MSRLSVAESLGVLLYNVQDYGFALKARLKEVFRQEDFEVYEATIFAEATGLLSTDELRVVLTSYDRESEGEIQAFLQFQNFSGVLIVFVEDDALDADPELEGRLDGWGVASVFMVPFDPVLLVRTVQSRLGQG